MGSGVDALRHETVYENEQLRSPLHEPAKLAPSRPISSDARGVCCRSSSASR